MLRPPRRNTYWTCEFHLTRNQYLELEDLSSWMPETATEDPFSPHPASDSCFQNRVFVIQYAVSTSFLTGGFMKEIDFPSFANFLVCTCVTLSGVYWLRGFTQQHDGENRYVFRSYLWWWMSWLVWAGTWALITFSSWGTSHPRALLGLSDLNAIILFSVYFSLTRGNEYKPILALIDFVGLCAIIAFGYGVFRFLLPERFDSLQTGWGLCLSAISTLAVGRAFAYRYQTRAVLIVGFIYAFAQPLAFDAILHKEITPDVNSILSAFKLVLAIFKVIWATVVTMYFTQTALTKENMVSGFSGVVSIPKLKELPTGFYIQTSVLFIVIVGLMSFVLMAKVPTLKRDDIMLILTAFGVFLAFVGTLAAILTLLKKSAEKPT